MRLLFKALKPYKFFIIIASVVIICNLFFFRLAFVFGSSMEPTLCANDCVLIWQFAYTPKQGDIVITNRQNAFGQDIVKRVIATEGQTVEISYNDISVNGHKLVEPYLAKDSSPTYIPLSLTVPEGYVFLLGDNRANSKDSRVIGCLPIQSIRGKILLRLFP